MTELHIINLTEVNRWKSRSIYIYLYLNVVALLGNGSKIITPFMQNPI